MSKLIASFIPNFWVPHLETDLEIIKSHVEAGDKVRVFVCNTELPSCYGNLVHTEDVCRHCVNRRRNGFELLGLYENVEIQNFLNIPAKDIETLNAYRNLKIESLDQLKEVRLENCQMGRAAFNEIASHLRETEPNVKENQEYISRVLESAAMVYLSFKNHFATYRPDRFYTFNGRFVVANAALAAAKAAGIPYAVHDRAWTLNRYTTVFDESLHSLEYWSRQAEARWDASEEPYAVKLQRGATWYEERIAGKKQSIESFTSDQRDELPPSFDEKKTNLVIFNTSEFETVGMDDYRLPFYEGQNQGIEAIARDLLGDANVQIYLRVHPNLKNRENTQTRGIRERLTNCFSNLEVIPADSPISTYKLMKHADAVLTFGSTTGAEAAYLSRPSILLGPGVYRGLNVCHVPQSHEELIELIKTRKFEISDPEELERRKVSAIKYAYFGQTNGNPFVYFEQTDVNQVIEKASQKAIDGNRPLGDTGLKAELASRVELAPPSPLHPLASVLAEATRAADELTRENESLRAQLTELQRSSAAHHGRLVASAHKITSLGRSFKRRLKRFL